MHTPAQRKIKVIIGINSLLMGGAQQQLVRQLRHYDYTRFDIRIVTLMRDAAWEKFVETLPQEVSLHTFAFGGFADVASWVALYRFLRIEKPDIVMSSLFFSNTIFRVLRPLCGYIAIAREHNTYIDKPRWQQWVDRILSRQSACIVAVSEEVADFTSAQEHIERTRFVVIENGIDLEEIAHARASIDKEGVRSALGISPDEHIALHVGRLVKQKNQKLLIEGFAQFVKKNPRWILLIVGGGGEYAALRALIGELQMEDRIRMVGEQKDVHPYYAISDCFISTSHMEGMSNTQLEALAHGLPILSTNTGGVGALVLPGHTGYLIEPNTEEEVARALCALQASDIDSMTVATRKHAKNFDVSRTVRVYESLFSSMVAADVSITKS